MPDINSWGNVMLENVIGATMMLMVIAVTSIFGVMLVMPDAFVSLMQQF